MYAIVSLQLEGINKWAVAVLRLRFDPQANEEIVLNKRDIVCGLTDNSYLMHYGLRYAVLRRTDETGIFFGHEEMPLLIVAMSPREDYATEPEEKKDWINGGPA